MPHAGGRIVRNRRRIAGCGAKLGHEQLDSAVAGVEHGQHGAGAAVRNVVGGAEHSCLRPRRPERPDQLPARAVCHDAVVSSVCDQYAALQVGLDAGRTRQPLGLPDRHDMDSRRAEHPHAVVARVGHYDAPASVGGNPLGRVEAAAAARRDRQRRGVVEFRGRAEIAQARPRHGRPARVAVRDGLEHPDAVVPRVGDDDAPARIDVDAHGEPEHAAAAQGQNVDPVRAEHLYPVVPAVGYHYVAVGADGDACLGRQVGVGRAARAERALVLAAGAEHLHPAVARVGDDVAPLRVGGQPLREAQPPVAKAVHRERAAVHAVVAEHLHAVVVRVGHHYSAAGADVHAVRHVELPVGAAGGPERVQGGAVRPEHRYPVPRRVRHDRPIPKVDGQIVHGADRPPVELCRVDPADLAARLVVHY